MIKLNLFSKTNKGGANSKIAASQPDASTASSNAPGKEANGHGHGPVKASSASRIALPSSKTREEGGKKDEKEPIQQQQQQHQARGIPTPKRKTEEKPLLAVKGVTKIAKPSGSLERKEKPKEDETVEAEKKTTVGVVSPIVKRHAAPESSVKREDLKNSDSVKNLVGRNVNPSCSDNAPSPASPKIPTMSQLSSYQLLLSPAQTRRHPPGPSYCTMQSSTSESSLDSLSTTVKSTQDRKGTSEMVRLRDRLNEYRDAIGGGLGYHNYEDSSSLSSEISDQFEPDTAPPVLKQQQRKHPSKSGKAQSGSSGHFALSATGTEPPTQTMTVATKLADYQHLLAKSPRSPSVGSDSHSSSGRTAQQNIDREVIHTLLQQCKTSQRGAAMQNFAHSSGSSSSGGFLPGDDARMNHKRSPILVIRDVRCVFVLGNAPSSSVLHFRVPLSRQEMGQFVLVISITPSGPLLHTHRGLTPLCLAEPKKTSPTQFIFKTSVAIFRLLSPSPSSPRHRLPLSVAQINSHANNNGLIRTEVIYANCVDRDPMRMQQEDNYGSCGSGSLRGSQLSLAGSATMPLNERYEAELVKMNRDLENCRVRVMTLTRKQEDYAHLFDVFDHKLSVMSKHVDKSQMKADDVKKLKEEIEHLRVISNRLAVTAEKKFEGAGELLRHPSLESVTSVASQRSSMSTSSKSSKATDKSSLNSFGKAKKSWIRSSFTKAFSKKKGKEIDEIDTNNRINEIEVDELKKKLEVRDTQLTDVRLDALDRAREVDVLRETVDKLKNENKQLRQDMHRLLSSTGTSCGRSRTSSQASMRTQLDEDVYDTPPHTSSSAASISSKRSSGCSTVRVTVNVDLKGVISKSVCPDNEIIVGYMEMPTKDTTWQEIDNITKDMFKKYMERIDPDSSLGLEDAYAVIGYEIGETVRDSSALPPTCTPFDVITPQTTVRMFLRGSCQQSVDSLVLESLFPRTMLEQLLRYLSTQRRLVLSGATGIGKSNLARQLAAYLCLKVGLPQDAVVDIKIPDDANDKSIVQVEQQLESLLNSSSPSVILIDNIPRHRIAFVASVFSNASGNSNQGPYVLCTVNRACQLPELNAHFKIFLLTNRMDGVKGFMARFLCRRIVEVEFRQCRQLCPDMMRVTHFLPVVLDAVNCFIEKANSLDVTVGPRIFLQCPLTLEESRQWFIKLWNTNIVPYMIKVAREGSRVLGRVCSAADDPTELVCEHWPWTEGPSAEESLHRLAIREDSTLSNLPNSKSTTTFNPLETLIRLQASKNAAANIATHTIVEHGI
ncbi:hypothetical protein WR25_02009 [Diploscapter pachys]|uniref:AAA+ ATPase domain-containing protein n=1 Tax=Diploscapter pachys TaxID=2018661 RepID=A0A2A2JNF6_9BILA|nr:hypothetical protein WR25_02009 [Diploscapter pachys]